MKMYLIIVVHLVLMHAVDAIVELIDGKMPTVNATGTVDTGTCLLAVRSTLRKTHSHDVSSQAPEAVAAYKMWRAKHKKVAANAVESMGVFDKFISQQKASEDACSSKLLEAKRSLDGLLKDLQRLSNDVEAQEMILQTEIENLHFTILSEKAVNVKYEDAKAKCRILVEEAKEELAQYQKELEELNQISKPSVRLDHATTSTAQSLLHAQSWTHERCSQFVGFLRNKQKQGVNTSHLVQILPEGLGSKKCDEDREELQKVFTQSYIEIRNLIQDAEDRLSMRKCMEPAIAMRTAALVPLIAQRDLAAERIELATGALSALDPVLMLVKRRSLKLYNHIHKTLVPECHTASQASEALESIREMILSLELCPGRNDFTLQIPPVEQEDKANHHENNHSANQLVDKARSALQLAAEKEAQATEPSSKEPKAEELKVESNATSVEAAAPATESPNS